MPERADKKTALVTGAGSGIGAAIAERLAAASYALVLVDIDEQALAGVCEKLDAETFALTLDVTDGAAVAGLTARIPASLGAIDVLVNAAGHDPGGTTRFDRGNADDWASAVETNLIGAMRVTHAVVPGMLERGRGDIVVIGSIAGIRIVPDMAAYNASKAGLHAFCDELRADLAETPIRVMEIMPGLTKTDLIPSCCRPTGGER
jgi:3-hydroxy acid dehydrogenase/malonic semialdehyde reductase